MRAPIFLPLLLLLPISLGACVSAPQPSAPPVAAIPARSPDKAARLAEIKRQIAAVCPATMTADELDLAATVVERHASDHEVAATVARLFKMDSEARICRGRAA